MSQSVEERDVVALCPKCWEEFDEAAPDGRRRTALVAQDFVPGGPKPGFCYCPIHGEMEWKALKEWAERTIGYVPGFRIDHLIDD